MVSICRATPSPGLILAIFSIATLAAAQDSKPLPLERVLSNVVSDDPPTREAALRDLNMRADLAAEAPRDLAASLSEPAADGWARKARAASAVILGARKRLDSHLESGGTEYDESGSKLKRAHDDAAALLLPPIRKGVETTVPANRAEAIRDLGSFGRDASDVVPLLVKIVSNPAEESAARTNAATALRRLRGLARAALDPLATVLDSTSGDVKAEVTGAIADILWGLAQSAAKDPGESAMTKVAISQEEWEGVRRNYAPRVVGQLARIVRGEDAMACWCAAVALGWLGEEATSTANDLLAAASTREGDVLLNLLWALNQFRWYDPPATALPTLMRALEIGPDGAREHAAWLMARLADKKVDLSKAVSLLLRQAAGQHAGAARAALGTLRDMGVAAKPWSKEIAALLGRPIADEAKIPVLDALAAIDATTIEDVELMRRLLANPDFWVQRSAMRALLASGKFDASFEDAVIPAIRGSVERWGASDLAEIAGGLKPSPKLTALFLELARRPEHEPDAGWIPALRATGASNEVMMKLIEDALVKPFNQNDAKEALQAAASLGLDDDALVRFYVKHLDVGNRDVREAAIDLLTKLGNKATGAVPALWDVQIALFVRAEEAAKQNDSSLSSFPDTSALNAIQSIGGTASLLPRIHEELGRRSGIPRRELIRLAARVDPASPQTTAAVRSLLASADREDRSTAVTTLYAIPSFPNRVEALEKLAMAEDDVAAEARAVLSEIAPASPVVAKSLLSALESGDDRATTEALAFFERAKEPPASFEQARLRLLGSQSLWSHQTARESYARRPPAGTPPRDALGAAARAAKTREERLLAALSAERATGPVPAAFFEASAPWLEWKDANLALLLLDSAGRNAARADAIAARLAAFVSERPSRPRANRESDDASRWDGAVLDATKVAATRIGPRAAAGVKAMNDALSKDGYETSWTRRAVEATTAAPRRRAAVTVREAAGEKGTAWGDRPRPGPRPGAFPDGSHRIVVDDGGEKRGRWIEIYLDVGPDGAPIWELLAFSFELEPAPAVKPLPVDEATINLFQAKGTTWATASVLAGSFTVRSGSETLAGRFELENPLLSGEASKGERR